ncbi:putative RNA-directed DNA polymerase [Tanacetum coccineum]
MAGDQENLNSTPKSGPDNKVGFIDGSIKKLEKMAADFMFWMHCDTMVKGWLTTAMEKDIRNSVKFSLERNKHEHQFLHTTLSYEDFGMNWRRFYLSHTVHVPLSSFAAIRTHILATYPVLKLRNAYHLVAEDERQRAISGEKKTMVDSTAFKTFSHDRKENNANQQRDKTIMRDNKRSETSEICTECGKEGNTHQGCFKLIGYPEWWPGNKKRDDSKPKAACIETCMSPVPSLTNEQYASFLKHFAGSMRRTKDDTNLTAFTGNIDSENDWVIDSGSTKHITHNVEILENKVSCFNENPVVILNGDFIPVEGKGECTLTRGAKIKGVLYIPKFTCNLLSVSRLCKDLQSAITFFPDFCVVQKLHMRILIGTGECKSGLYRMGMFGTEKKALMTTTNTLENLPEGKHAIDSIWVYKIKYKPNGEVERYKARLVAKGFTQMEGVDYHNTFTPVAKLVTVLTLLAIVVKRDWMIHQLDVNNAFLHGDLSEEIYMKIPQGFVKDGDMRICRLHKSLYGLKQASRNWYKKFTNALRLLYVDDVVIAGNDTFKIQATKDELNQRFSIKDLGTLKYFLGIKVARTYEGLVLNQRKYILDILADCGLQGCKSSPFPIEQNLKLNRAENKPKVDASRYRRIVGRLLYLQATRPDITYSVNILSQFMADPRQPHLNAAHRILHYLKATPGLGILLSRYLLSLGGAPISWKTKKQSVVSRSSAEAEYRSMAGTVSEILWVRWLLRELDIHMEQPTPLFCDNQAAQHIANNPVFHERTKHVKMDCYFVHERVESKEVEPLSVKSTMQIADLLTKGLGTDQLRFLLDKLGVRNLHAPT